MVQRFERGPDPCIVRNPAVFDGHVVIDAYQYTPIAQNCLGQILQTTFVHSVGVLTSMSEGAVLVHVFVHVLAHGRYSRERERKRERERVWYRARGLGLVLYRSEMRRWTQARNR